MKNFFPKILLSIFGGDGHTEIFTQTNYNYIYAYLNQKILKRPDWYTLKTKNDFELLMSAIDWEKNELSGEPLREWQIKYFDSLIKSKMFFSNSYQHHLKSGIKYEIEIKDFSTVSKNSFMNELDTFRVELINVSNETKMSIMNSSEEGFLSKSILLNILSVCAGIISISAVFLVGDFFVFLIMSIFYKPKWDFILYKEFLIQFSFFLIPTIILLIYIACIINKMRKERLRLFQINLFKQTGLWDFIK